MNFRKEKTKDFAHLEMEEFPTAFLGQFQVVQIKGDQNGSDIQVYMIFVQKYLMIDNVSAVCIGSNIELNPPVLASSALAAV